jgi:hypothetical protein
MRTLALSAAAALAASGVLLGTSPAQAYACPPPFVYGTYTVAGHTVNGCRLGPIIQCDPGPCDVAVVAGR